MAMTLTDAQRATYTARLAAAEEAFHQLRLGSQAKVVVDQNGERVEMTVARSSELRAYILELKTLLGLPTDIVGPLKPWFL